MQYLQSPAFKALNLTLRNGKIKMIKTYIIPTFKSGPPGIKGPSAWAKSLLSLIMLATWQRGNGSELFRKPSIVHQFHIAQVLLPFVEKKPFVEHLAVDSC